MVRSFNINETTKLNGKSTIVNKKSQPVRNVTKTIKQILEEEYKIINLKTIIMSLNYLKVKHKNSLLELLQICEEMIDGTLGKYTDSNYTIE